jgi:hypothetical protein
MNLSGEKMLEAPNTETSTYRSNILAICGGGLPKDERTFWLKSVKRRVEGLDALIVDYVS